MHFNYCVSYTCIYLSEVIFVSFHVGREEESHGGTAENASGQNVPCHAGDKLQLSCLFSAGGGKEGKRDGAQ